MADEPSSARAFARRAASALGRSLTRAFGDDGSIAPRDRRGILGFALVVGGVLFALSYERYATFHNRSFDLAFYARLAWGEAHLDGWEPIVDAHVYGLHFVWALEILGWIGALFGQVRTLLFAQSLAVALAAIPFARIGARILSASGARPPGVGSSGVGLDRLGAYAGALGWLLQPNLWHVATNDFHPGTLATLPLAWSCDALHRRDPHALAWSSLGVLACREDLGLVVALFGVAFAIGTRRDAEHRRLGVAVAASAAAYVAAFLGYFHPRYAPAQGSFALHFAHWGSSPAGVLGHLVAHPLELLAWLATPERAPYLLVITAPLAFLAFLAPEWLLLAAPVLAVNLLSSFPTTLFLDSHYLTPALPVLVAASLVGAGRAALALRLSPRTRGALAITPLAIVLGAQLLAGGSPFSQRFDAAAYVPDARTEVIARALAAIPEEASVQAPDRVLAHLAERRVVRRAPPPESSTDYVVLDAWVRVLEQHREELLRTDEEPLLRDWLAREDHALVAGDPSFLVLARDAPPEQDIGRAAIVGRGDPEAARPLTACLALLDARLDDAHGGEGGASLVLTLVARAACPSDLALRIGWGHRPRRVDLIADGLLSPARFSPGDRIESRHALDPAEMEAIRAHGLRVGAIRQSGARPDHDDPAALDVPLGR